RTVALAVDVDRVALDLLDRLELAGALVREAARHTRPAVLGAVAVLVPRVAIARLVTVENPVTGNRRMRRDGVRNATELIRPADHALDTAGRLGLQVLLRK